jgi:hypothetical protein
LTNGIYYARSEPVQLPGVAAIEGEASASKA